MMEQGEFEIRFAAFMSDPIVFLEKIRTDYLDAHEGDESTLVEDVIDEITPYLEQAADTQPQAEESRFRELFLANDREDMDESARQIFMLLKEAGFSKSSIQRYIATIPEVVSLEKELQMRGEGTILNEVYDEQ